MCMLRFFSCSALGCISGNLEALTARLVLVVIPGCNILQVSSPLVLSEQIESETLHGTRITRKGLQSKRATASLLIENIISCRKNRVCCCSVAKK